MTLANASIIGNHPHALSIDTHNRIYAVNHANGQIHVWLDDESGPNIILSDNLVKPKFIFVTNNGDIYVDNFGQNGHVVKFTLNSNESISVMSVPTHCYGLFVDIADNLYCSATHGHQVLKKWLGDNSTISSRVAGTGLLGSASNQLNQPNGMFVDTNFDLYVADYRNNRIQLFRLGQQYGITVVGKNSKNSTIELKGPVNVILDGNKYLFITEHRHCRVIQQGPYGFHCIVGCSHRGSATDELNGPRSIAFDSFGNLFVVDANNHRIQKFTFQGNLCSK